MIHLKILECTLRDGSYSLDYQFTAAHTAAIAGALERLGFDLIEIGHGIGLGASEKGLGKAAETDEGYMRAAAGALTTARWGMFGIPGIMTMEMLEGAADLGMGFVRVGTNVTEVEQAAPFLRRAKERGMWVCSNLMKSYAVSPAEFAARVEEAASLGADVVYLVDSAGGMMPDDIARRLDAARARCDVRLGFHGHNNLGMAVWNSVHAFQHGASVLDSTLQGLGRSSGNAPTEQLLCALERMGHGLGIDVLDVMNAGEALIRPLMSWQAGQSSLDTVSGYAEFHSSHGKLVDDVARAHGVDPRRLIIAVCRKDKVHAPRELVEAEARQLAAS